MKFIVFLIFSVSKRYQFETNKKMVAVYCVFIAYVTIVAQRVRGRIWEYMVVRSLCST